MLYALAVPALVGGFCLSGLFVTIYAAFGVPATLSGRFEAALLTLGPAFLALLVVVIARRLWLGGRRRPAVVVLAAVDVSALLIAAWWGGLL